MNPIETYIDANGPTGREHRALVTDHTTGEPLYRTVGCSSPLAADVAARNWIRRRNGQPAERQARRVGRRRTVAGSREPVAGKDV